MAWFTIRRLGANQDWVNPMPPEGVEHGEGLDRRQPQLVRTEPVAMFPTYVHRASLDSSSDATFTQRVVDFISGLHLSSEPSADPMTSFDWTSDADLHVKYTEFASIAEAFQQLAADWAEQVGLTHDGLVVTECWGNVVSPGGSTVRHHHRGAYLSGVYYPTAYGDAGDLVFHDPRGARVQLAPVGVNEPGHSESIVVKEGLMLLFPAWLEHSVGPNLSGRERISVACNVVPMGCTSSPRAPLQPRLSIEEPGKSADASAIRALAARPDLQ